VEKDSGPVSGPKGQQLHVTGGVEGAADGHGQLSKLGGGRCGEFMCLSWGDFCEEAVHVSACVKCGAVGGGERTQVGGSHGEDSGNSCCRGGEGGRACFRGKAGYA
jgi:hypothetical protein